jgi:hypothetical protein
MTQVAAVPSLKFQCCSELDMKTNFNCTWTNIKFLHEHCVMKVGILCHQFGHLVM